MGKLTKNAEYLLKEAFKKSGLELFENQSGGVVGFVVKDKAGHSQSIDLRVIMLNSTIGKVIIPKSDWNHELPENRWVALVLFMQGIDPHIYLIPSDVFRKPDDYIFFDNEQSERFSHLSTWEIRVFSEGIEKLSEYGFANSVKQLT